MNALTRTAKLYRYKLPIQTQLILRGTELRWREGLIVQLQTGDLQSFGEIAPLAGFSQESLAQAETQTKAWLKVWQQGAMPDLETLFPSVAFGISCALAELDGTLSPHAHFDSVPLCLSYQDFPKLQNAPLAKLKVGVQAVENEGKFANTLFEQLPNLRLRLDANRKWSLAQALAFAAQIAPQHRARFEFIEEPCHTPDLSRQFAIETGISIAWDETVREPHFRVQAEPNLAAIVIKPTLVGTLTKCRTLLAQAQQQGLQAVISSSIESSLALTQLARFATQHTPNSPAGLDTLNLMQHQLLREWRGSTLPLVGLDSEFVEQIELRTNEYEPIG